MKRERINKALQCELQIAYAEQQLAAAKRRLERWDERLRMLREKQQKLSLESQLPLGPSTNKNKRKYVAWYKVRAILREQAQPFGMTTAELHREFCDEFPRMNIVTFRAYLREFSQPNRRLLKRQNDRWALY
jgi:hypothetical protein